MYSKFVLRKKLVHLYLGTIGIKGNTRGFWIYVGSGTCFDLCIRRYTRIYGGIVGLNGNLWA